MSNDSAGGAGPVRIRFAARTDRGLVRRGNQDSAYAGSRLLAVADGMGGMAAGDLASAIVIAAMAPLDQQPCPVGGAVDALREMIDRANEGLREAVAADPSRRGMGTTLTGLLLAGDEIAMVHIGDSRAYLLRDGELSQLTRDDTFVQLLVEDGHITAAEAETHPQRFLVTKALQGSDVMADYTVSQACPGDRYLLCSDGLSGVVDFAMLRATLDDVADLDECAERLVELALDGGAPDNVTAVLADITLDEVDPQTPTILGAAAAA